MTAKRWEIIDEEFISYTGGTAQLISNGECEIHLWERPQDAQLFCDKLNAINEEKEQLKTVINRYEKYSNKKNDELNFRQLDILKLKEENEQLKSSDTITDLETEIMNLKTTIQQLTNDNTKQKKLLNTTMKENEQLKKEIEELKQALIHSAFDR